MTEKLIALIWGIYKWGIISAVLAVLALFFYLVGIIMLFELFLPEYMAALAE